MNSSSLFEEEELSLSLNCLVSRLLKLAEGSLKLAEGSIKLAEESDYLCYCMLKLSVISRKL